MVTPNAALERDTWKIWQQSGVFVHIEPSVNKMSRSFLHTDAIAQSFASVTLSGPDDLIENGILGNSI